MLEVLLFATLAILVGLGLSFAGYAAFRLILPILGFFAGFWFGMDLVANFAANFPFLGVSFGLILGLVFGLIMAAIAYYIYAFAVIIFGFALGYALGAGLMLALGFAPGFMTFLVGIVAAAAMGWFFMRGEMPKIYIMVLTAFAGASAMIAGVLALFGQIPASQLGLSFVQPYIGDHFFLTVAWLVIGFIGVAIQYQMAKMAESMIPETYSYDAVVVENEAKAKKEKKA